MNKIEVGTPNQNDSVFVPSPESDEAVERLAGMGYLPCVPPSDYAGSIADWVAKIADLGGPDEYEELCETMVRADVWERVLDECELR